MVKKTIVIAGVGFAGITCAQQLQKALRNNPSIELVLINEDNFLLFRPMLPQVASGAIKTRNVLIPLRSILDMKKSVRFYEGRVKDIDPVAKKVSVWGTPEKPGFVLDYDYLVVALGSETNFYGMTDIEKHAFRMKTLYDAVAVRNRVIDMLEQADNATDEQTKRSLLTFIIVGGGFSGIETAGELYDLLDDAVQRYQSINMDMVSVVVVEGRPAILSGFDESLTKFAHELLDQKGIVIKLQARVASFNGNEADIRREGNSEIISAKTLIWTAGLTPANTVQRSVFRMDSGKIMVDDYLEAVGYPGVFVAGDCAMFMDPDTGRPYPPTGQMATAQGKTAAINLSATINGTPKKKFVYKPLGHMAVIGKRTAIAQVFGINMHGVIAWMLWRAVFLSKMPILSKRIRVMMDWFEDAVFERDIARIKFIGRTPDVKEYRDLDAVDDFW